MIVSEGGRPRDEPTGHDRQHGNGAGHHNQQEHVVHSTTEENILLLI